MPRSGPRPYECVRRAWHSERHQPMRGSLIKEIFRVVNEIHSSATKKNKEWQEKLPIVVLKAEEIMYSKANSEAEYMDLKTLWDRTNDAINTIIRRDETTETGEFLQPCIEAALNLGCIARKATRSQRNTNPRCYLMPVTSDVPSISPSVVEDANKKDYTSNLQYRPHCSNFVNPKTTNSTPLVFETRCPVAQYNDCGSMKFSVASENVPPSGYDDQCFSRKNLATSNFPKYPLYYGNLPQFKELKPGSVVLPKPVSDPLEPAKIGVIPNLLCNGDKSNNNTQTERRDYHENPCLIGCDLSLRLGPLSSQLPSGENSKPQEGKNVGVEEQTKCSDRSPQFDKQFYLIPKGSEYGPTDSWGRLSFDGEDIYVQSATRKRKAAFNHPAEDSKFCRQPELPFSHFNGSMRNGGL